MHQVIVIPARMKGTRLPGKPLIEILGKTVLQRVWERCSEVMDKKNIYVATEDRDKSGSKSKSPKATFTLK